MTDMGRQICTLSITITTLQDVAWYFSKFLSSYQISPKSKIYDEWNSSYGPLAFLHLLQPKVRTKVITIYFIIVESSTTPQILRIPF